MTVLAVASKSLGCSYFANIWCDYSFKVVLFCSTLCAKLKSIAIVLHMLCSSQFLYDLLLGLVWYYSRFSMRLFTGNCGNDLFVALLMTLLVNSALQVLHQCWPPSYVFFVVLTTETKPHKTFIISDGLIDGFVPHN